MNTTPPKLTPEQIWNNDAIMVVNADLGLTMDDLSLIINTIESLRDQQWLDMLAAAPGVEEIMRLADAYRDAFGVFSETRLERRHALRTAVEQALAARVPTLPFAVFDEFGQPCEDRVRDHFAAAPQPPQQPAEWVGLTDEQIVEAFCKHPLENEYAKVFEQGALWADALLREKNGGVK